MSPGCQSHLAKSRVYIVMRTIWRDDSSDEALIKASLRDPEAFGAFYRRYAVAVHRFFSARLGDWNVASDLTAEVFVAAVAQRTRFDPDRGSAQAWLWQIARSRLAGYLRHQEVADRRHDEMRMTAKESSSDEYDLGAEETRALEALDRLPGEQRTAVKQHVIDELSYTEIAARTGTSAATVRKRVSRGLQALRRALREPEQCSYSTPETTND